MDYPFQVPSIWKLSRKHFRISLGEGRFVKLNRFENRLNNSRDLKFYCWKLKPRHVYFSVLNWLFPERVGNKYKARYCVPLNGEYVIDVDSYLMIFKHNHRIEDPLVCLQRMFGHEQTADPAALRRHPEILLETGRGVQWLSGIPCSRDGFRLSRLGFLHTRRPDSVPFSFQIQVYEALAEANSRF